MSDSPNCKCVILHVSDSPNCKCVILHVTDSPNCKCVIFQSTFGELHTGNSEKSAKFSENDITAVAAEMCATYLHNLKVGLSEEFKHRYRVIKYEDVSIFPFKPQPINTIFSNNTTVLKSWPLKTHNFDRSPPKDWASFSSYNL